MIAAVVVFSIAMVLCAAIAFGLSITIDWIRRAKD
jgi:hypothetical protein